MFHLKVLVAIDTSTMLLCIKRRPITRLRGLPIDLRRTEADNARASCSSVMWIGMIEDLIPPITPILGRTAPQTVGACVGQLADVACWGF